MRTNVDINDDLLDEARKATGLKTKKAVLEEGLRHLVRRARQLQALKDLEGTEWEGDIRAMRRNRSLPEW